MNILEYIMAIYKSILGWIQIEYLFIVMAVDVLSRKGEFCVFLPRTGT